MGWKLLSEHWSCKSKGEIILNPMINISILLIVAFILAIITLIIQTTHFLLSLFCLEAILLSAIIITCLIVNIINIDLPFIAILILTLGACEASLGLRLIVSISRKIGSDIINNLTINKC